MIFIGVGVDDMIIIVDTLNHTKLPNNNEDNRAKQLGLALQHSGISISLTSFCSIVAFFAGTITDLPGVQYFCYYAAFSFLGNYLLQFLLFVPLLTLDNKRIRGNRNFCCPCITHSDVQQSFEDEEDEVPHDDTPAKRCTLNWFLENTFIKVLSSAIGRIVIIIIFLILVGISGWAATKVKALSDPTLLVPDDSFLITYTDIVDSAYGGLL